MAGITLFKADERGHFPSRSNRAHESVSAFLSSGSTRVSCRADRTLDTCIPRRCASSDTQDTAEVVNALPPFAHYQVIEQRVHLNSQQLGYDAKALPRQRHSGDTFYGGADRSVPNGVNTSRLVGWSRRRFQVISFYRAEHCATTKPLATLPFSPPACTWLGCAVHRRTIEKRLPVFHRMSFTTPFPCPKSQAERLQRSRDPRGCCSCRPRQPS